jgi:hypothetical protein
MSPAGLHDGYRYPVLASPLEVGPRAEGALTGTICHTWPTADIGRGFVG